MRASVNQDTCTGCGTCVNICPEVFKIEGDKATVYVDSVPEGAEDKAQQAQENCPPNAISVQ